MALIVVVAVAIAVAALVRVVVALGVVSTTTDAATAEASATRASTLLLLGLVGAPIVVVIPSWCHAKFQLNQPMTRLVNFFVDCGQRINLAQLTPDYRVE